MTKTAEDAEDAEKLWDQDRQRSLYSLRPLRYFFHDFSWTKTE